jgi:hypothetical protein
VSAVFRDGPDAVILGEWGLRVEGLIAEPLSRRRYRLKEERRQVVEETLQPGASVAAIARRHEVNANQVFHWRKVYREGRLDVELAAQELVPVRITEVVSGEHGGYGSSLSRGSA